MKKFKQYSNIALISMLFALTVFTAGCGGGSSCAGATITTIPVDGATGVALDVNISGYSDKAFDPTTVNETTFTLMTTDGEYPVAGEVTSVGNSMVFNPTYPLVEGTEYTATITTGVLDESGRVSLLGSDLIWSFTAGTTMDNVAPTVILTDPDSNETNVSINTIVSALFSEPLAPSSTTGIGTFTLVETNSSIEVNGSVSFDGSSTMSFTPDANLAPDTNYTATITTDVTDVAGNAMEADYTWNFTTGASVAAGPARVNLGTAGKFAILTKTGISTTGTTLITGDIGTSPAPLSYITGFALTLHSSTTYATSDLVIGKIYAADLTPPTPAKMTTAVSNMEAAYTDAAAGRSGTISLGSASTGTPYAAGVYKTDTGFLIAGDMTIDGGPNDIWIFQIAGDLTVADNVSVTLTGGAQAKNVFWQVAGGTGVTLNSASHFEGIVLAAKAIILKDGATVNGRLLSQTAVTLIGNTVTQP